MWTKGRPLNPTRLRFGPDLRLTALSFVLGLGALALALATDDAGGRILWSIAALVLVGYGIGDVAFWPRLVADSSGLQVRSPFARADLPWSAVERVHADVRSRYGLRSTTLEIDAGQMLVVLSRRALGADPAVVQDLVNGMRRGPVPPAS